MKPRGRNLNLWRTISETSESSASCESLASYDSYDSIVSSESVASTKRDEVHEDDKEDRWNITVTRKGEKNFSRQRICTKIEAKYVKNSVAVVDGRNKIVIIDGRVRQIKTFSDGINLTIDIPEKEAPLVD